MNNNVLTGCYIDEAVPRTQMQVTERLLDLLVRVGGSRNTWLPHLFSPDEDDYEQIMSEIQLEIEAKINKYLPEGLYATWSDGNFIITDESEDEE